MWGKNNKEESSNFESSFRIFQILREYNKFLSADTAYG